MGLGLLEGLAKIAVALVVVLAAVRPGLLRAPVVATARGLRRLRPQPPRPAGRPIEEIAHDVRRLAHAFGHRPTGMSWARNEGLRRAYDDVLAEACRALGHEHLFDVLPPGPERDAERVRVALLLDAYGFRMPDVA